jgi:pyruvate/2-oxoglutarate dehydrogenase complex dihydrolipoamide acyltransferase (E2) component
VSSSTTDPTLVDVPMPQMGVSVAEGTVVAWSVEVGGAVEADQTICEISTDKIETEVPAPLAGVLAEILVGVGETVEVGAVLARIAAAGSGSGRAGLRPGPVEGVSGSAAGRSVPPTDAPRALPAVQSGVARRSSPVVQRIAAGHGIDLAAVAGTGRGGRVTKRDVLAHLERHANGPVAAAERPLHSESPYRPEPQPVDAERAAAPPTEPVVVDGATSAGAAAAALHPSTGPARSTAGAHPEAPAGTSRQLSRIRQSIGAAMLRSQATAATCTTIIECDMSRVERVRKELGLTALPLVARATVDALAELPDLNATLEGTTVTRYERIHLGIAVSLGDEGLIVPVIHDAQDLSSDEIGRRIKELATRARTQRLTPDDVHGATFTITSPGRFGAMIATPVINIPQVAILDVEAVVRRPVVVTDADGEEAIAIRPMVHLCMSWDHRALDGAYAAQFLTALRRRLEDG